MDSLSCSSFPYMYNPPNQIFKHKHLWVKKATRLGVTEFMLILMAWLCTANPGFMNCQMYIVTGPNIEMAKWQSD